MDAVAHTASAELQLTFTGDLLTLVYLSCFLLFSAPPLYCSRPPVGDIYYVGDEPEIKSNCLGIAPEGVKQGVTWPHGSIGSFAVQGNHVRSTRWMTAAAGR